MKDTDIPGYYPCKDCFYGCDPWERDKCSFLYGREYVDRTEYKRKDIKHD